MRILHTYLIIFIVFVVLLYICSLTTIYRCKKSKFKQSGNTWKNVGNPTYYAIQSAIDVGKLNYRNFSSCPGDSCSKVGAKPGDICSSWGGWVCADSSGRIPYSTSLLPWTNISWNELAYIKQARWFKYLPDKGETGVCSDYNCLASMNGQLCTTGYICGAAPDFSYKWLEVKDDEIKENMKQLNDTLKDINPHRDYRPPLNSCPGYSCLSALNGAYCTSGSTTYICAPPSQSDGNKVAKTEYVDKYSYLFCPPGYFSKKGSQECHHWADPQNGKKLPNGKQDTYGYFPKDCIKGQNCQWEYPTGGGMKNSSNWSANTTNTYIPTIDRTGTVQWKDADNYAKVLSGGWTWRCRHALGEGCYCKGPDGPWVEHPRCSMPGNFGCTTNEEAMPGNGSGYCSAFFANKSVTKTTDMPLPSNYTRKGCTDCTTEGTTLTCTCDGSKKSINWNDCPAKLSAFQATTAFKYPNWGIKYEDGSLQCNWTDDKHWKDSITCPSCSGPNAVDWEGIGEGLEGGLHVAIEVAFSLI